MSVAGTLYEETVQKGFARLLTTQAANNSATITFVSGLESNSPYDTFLFDFTDVKPNTVSTYLRAQWSYDGGATWIGTAHFQAYTNSFYNTGSNISGTSTSGSFDLSNSGANTLTGLSFGGELWLHRGPTPYANPNYSYVIWHLLTWSQAYGSLYLAGSGFAASTLGTPNAFRFFFGSGNIVSGAFRMYGIKRGT
jgi:hypothetical protein